MKETGLVIVAGAVLVVATLGSFAFAQSPGDVKAGDAQTGTAVSASGQPAVVGVPQSGMKGSGVNLKCQTGSMMLGDLGGSDMVVLPDGSFVVRVGNALIKYDSDLNVIKEAKIKIDFDARQKEYDELMKECPSMMGVGGMMGGMVLVPQPPPTMTTTTHDVPKRR